MSLVVDFSDRVPCTVQPSFSPDKRLVANAKDRALVVRDVESLSVVAITHCLEPIDTLVWSPDGSKILCVCQTQGTVHVFCISDPDYSASISEPLAGVVSAKFAPNGQSILITSDFQIKLSVWSLVDQTSIHLRAPKHDQAGLTCSPDNQMLASLERVDCKDFISVYDTTTWQPLARFALPTQDAADLSWCPDSSCIAVWDNPAYGHKLAVLTPSGEILAIRSDYKEGLGIKSVAWSPSGQLLAVATYEKDVDILNSATWEPLCNLAHPSSVAGPTELVVYSEVEQELPRVLQDSNGAAAAIDRKPSTASTTGGRKETESSAAVNNNKPTWRPGTGSRPTSNSSSRSASPSKMDRAGSGRLPSPRKGPSMSRAASRTGLDDLNNAADDEYHLVRSRYIVAELPVRLPPPPRHQTTTQQDTANPKMGVSLLSFSTDGVYLATRSDSSPSSLWIWDITTLTLAAILLQSHPVRSFTWAPVETGSYQLVVASGSGRVYIWSPEGASCVHIPLQGMRVSELEWNDEGSVLLASGKGGYCCGYWHRDGF